MNIEQQNPDYCYSEKEYESFKKNSFNQRYSYFRQNYYTAGDLEQFIHHWKNLVRNKERNQLLYETIKGLDIDTIFQNDLCIHDYYNTFQYINEKFKKGCFLQIHENELKTYIPFSRQSFKNEWGSSIVIDPKFENINNMMKYLSEIDDTFPFDEKKNNRDVNAWYGNNGLVRFEFPLSEKDNGYNVLKDMFLSLSKERDVPDVDFFMNKRDYPILRNDGMEAYDVFFGDNQPLLSHKYEKYVPILSMNTADGFADIAIPTWEDWKRVSYLYDGRMFPKDFHIYHKQEEFDSILWEDKKPTAIWRGASTGLGTTESDNIRLFVYKKFQEKVDVDGNLFVDAKISKWNLRPRKHKNNPYLRTILKEDFDMKTCSYMSPLEQAQYKYILHLPGHTCAYRLSLEMFMGSVILYYPSPNRLWFFHLLEPWVHYVPIEKEFDEEEICEKIRWCKENDEKCKEIVKNAREFADKHLTRDGILDFLQQLLTSLSSKNTIEYNDDSLHGKQLANLVSKIEEYETTYLSPFPVDFFQKNLFLQMHKYKNYYFYHLDKTDQFDRFLETSLVTSKIINSKKTTINLYKHEQFQWLEKIVKSDWKRDDLHQIYVGYYFINNLRSMCPNFIHTYFHKIEEEQTKLYIEYVDTITLDKKIREQGYTSTNQKVKKDFRLIDLVNIWVNICCALQIAQDYCGFVHMDLYPWNILIKENTRSIHYKNLGIETNFRYNPVIIDYGNSHVVKDGFHNYNTTPFQLSSFSDVMCLIITSLDVFLSKVTLTDYDRKLLIKIIDFVTSFDLFKDYKLKNIRDIKNFLKENKKFSKMLENLDSFSNKRPIDFIHYLYSNKCLEKNQIYFHKTTSPLIIIPLPFQNLQDQLHFLNEITKTQKHNFPMDDILFLSRRIVTTLKNISKQTRGNTIYKKEYTNYLVHHFIEKFKRYIQNTQKTQKKKIWNGIDSSLLLNDILVEHERNETVLNHCVSSLKREFKHPQVPLLKTHLCNKCNDWKPSVNMEFFDYLNLVQFSKENFDMFLLKNQTLSF
jgi:hypothetical protein